MLPVVACTRLQTIFDSVLLPTPFKRNRGTSDATARLSNSCAALNSLGIQHPPTWAVVLCLHWWPACAARCNGTCSSLKNDFFSITDRLRLMRGNGAYSRIAVAVISVPAGCLTWCLWSPAQPWVQPSHPGCSAASCRQLPSTPFRCRTPLAAKRTGRLSPVRDRLSTSA